MNNNATTIQQHFRERFSTQPVLYYSPGRINLIGEHVDYNDGFVMPAAIDKGIYYAVALNDTNTIHFYAADPGAALSVNVDNIKKLDGWKNYVLSVVNEFIVAGYPVKGFDCAFGGDIPQGSGMSSSAAVEGGLAFALNELFAFGLSRIELAKLCQRAEHNFPGVQCGIMDQFANMMGQKGQVILLDCRDLSHQYFPLEISGYRIVLLDTGVHHSLAAGEYNLRRQQCAEGLKSMNMASFRDIQKADELLAHRESMGEEVYMRCRYVVEEIRRTKEAAALLQQNDIEGFGKLMYASHDGLSSLYQVSCKELDLLVTLASQEGVTGARMMGGGFGGCTINIIKEAGADAFIEKAVTTFYAAFNVAPEAYVVEISDGTRELV